jgi:hypothetical protein
MFETITISPLSFVSETSDERCEFDNVEEFCKALFKEVLMNLADDFIWTNKECLILSSSLRCNDLENDATAKEIFLTALSKNKITWDETTWLMETLAIIGNKGDYLSKYLEIIKELEKK